MPQDYTYAVARIRSRENSLFSNSDLEQLMSQKSLDSCIRFLHEKGWGDSSKNETPEDILKAERERTWQFMHELVSDEHAFDIFLIPNDFHNLKVSVKSVTRGSKTDKMFIDNATVAPEIIYNAVGKRDYSLLPEYLVEPATQAMKTILQTSDGQLCDIIIDTACLDTVYSIGQESENEFVRLYSELYVASADIRVAVRSVRTNKSLDFIKRSLADCQSLNIDKLALAATKSFDDIVAYLSDTSYKDACEALSISMSAFEKWCDDLLTDKMQSQKWEPFLFGPLVAYIIARENEIKAVRMILSAKLNNLDDSIIRERLREMYV